MPGLEFTRILRDALDATRGLGARADAVAQDVVSSGHTDLYRSALALEDAARTASPSFDRLIAVARRARHDTLDSLQEALAEAPGRAEDAALLRTLLIEHRRIREVMLSTTRQINEILGGLNRDMARMETGARRDTVLGKA